MILPDEGSDQIDRILIYIIALAAVLIATALLLGVTIQRLDKLELRAGPDCPRVAVMAGDGTMTAVCAP